MIGAVLVLALLLVGVWGVLAPRNLVKKIMALGILNSAIVVLFITLGARTGSTAPILVGGASDVVDPVPQALMLTAIVVGVCVTALGLALVYRLFRRYQTTNIAEIEGRTRDEDA